jgi:hypothetical protein
MRLSTRTRLWLVLTDSHSDEGTVNPIYAISKPTGFKIPSGFQKETLSCRDK